MRFGTFGSLCAISLALMASGQPTHAQATVEAMIAQLGTCIGMDRPLRLIVPGLPNDQTVLSADQASKLRLDIEAMFTDLAEIGTARDLTQLRGLLEGSGAQVATQTLVENANAGDAAIFVVDPSRNGDALDFRLQAISMDGRCKSTSELIAVGLTRTGAASIDRVLETALDDLLRIAPQTQSIAVCPVVAEAGYSSCSGAVTTALAAGATQKARDANRILTGRSLDVVKLDSAACGQTSQLRGTGTLSRDAVGDVWFSLAFQQGTQVVSALPRTRVDLGALGCDAAVRPLLDYISLTASRSPARLDLSAPVFGQGQRLDVRVDLPQAGALYCWVIAPDETAFVVLPVGEDIAWGAGAYHYPADFGLGDIVLEGSFENLFHCFAPSADLPMNIAAMWRDFGPGGAGQTLLDSATITTMLDAMRAQPGMTEATTRIIVREAG